MPYRVDSGIIRFSALESVSGLRHGTTCRGFGPSGQAKRPLLEAVCRTLELSPRRMAWGRQVHGCNQAVITGPDDDEQATVEIGDTDAFITAEPGILIAVFTADCVPVFIVDPVKRVGAVVHSGWRGTLARITERTISTLRPRFGCRAEDLLVCLGPAISGRHYEVSTELAAEFAAAFPEQPKAVNGRYVDLPRLCLAQARARGVPQEQCVNPDICTLEEEVLCESYRRDGPRAGRMASFLMFEE